MASPNDLQFQGKDQHVSAPECVCIILLLHLSDFVSVVPSSDLMVHVYSVLCYWILDFAHVTNRDLKNKKT